jgi:ribosomal protein S7
MIRYRDKLRSFIHKFENNFSYLCFKYHFQFFQSLIFRGRKLWAFKFFTIVKNSLKRFENIDPFLIFIVSITNIVPEVLLFPIKFAGLISQVGLPISTKKQIIFSTKWIIKLLKDKFTIVTIKNVSDLLIYSLYNVGIAVQKKKQIHAIAKDNRYLIKFFKK